MVGGASTGGPGGWISRRARSSSLRPESIGGATGGRVVVCSGVLGVRGSVVVVVGGGVAGGVVVGGVVGGTFGVGGGVTGVGVVTGGGGVGAFGGGGGVTGVGVVAGGGALGGGGGGVVGVDGGVEVEPHGGKVVCGTVTC